MVSDGHRSETVTVRGSMRSNDNTALLEAARDGIGIVGAGEWLVTRDIADGTLIRILPNRAFDVDGGVFLVRPSAQHAPARQTRSSSGCANSFANTRRGPGMIAGRPDFRQSIIAPAN